MLTYSLIQAAGNNTICSTSLSSQDTDSIDILIENHRQDEKWFTTKTCSCTIVSKKNYNLQAVLEEFHTILSEDELCIPYINLEYKYNTKYTSMYRVCASEYKYHEPHSLLLALTNQSKVTFTMQNAKSGNIKGILKLKASNPLTDLRVACTEVQNTQESEICPCMGIEPRPLLPLVESSSGSSLGAKQLVGITVTVPILILGLNVIGYFIRKYIYKQGNRKKSSHKKGITNPEFKGIQASDPSLAEPGLYNRNYPLYGNDRIKLTPDKYSDGSSMYSYGNSLHYSTPSIDRLDSEDIPRLTRRTDSLESLKANYGHQHGSYVDTNYCTDNGIAQSKGQNHETEC